MEVMQHTVMAVCLLSAAVGMVGLAMPHGSLGRQVRLILELLFVLALASPLLHRQIAFSPGQGNLQQEVQMQAAEDALREQIIAESRPRVEAALCGLLTESGIACTKMEADLTREKKVNIEETPESAEHTDAHGQPVPDAIIIAEPFGRVGGELRGGSHGLHDLVCDPVDWHAAVVHLVEIIQIDGGGNRTGAGYDGQPLTDRSVVFQDLFRADFAGIPQLLLNQNAYRVQKIIESHRYLLHEGRVSVQRIVVLTGKLRWECSAIIAKLRGRIYGKNDEQLYRRIRHNILK